MKPTISLALLLAVLSLACGDSANPGGKCRVGQPIACACDDGRSGRGTCGEEACDCSPTYALRAEPGSLDLGEVAPGTTREGQLTIHNPAPREVRLRSVAVSPPGEGFDPVPQAPQAIPAGGSVVVTVRFTATTPGAAVARLRVEPDDADVAPVEVSVTVLVPGPLLSCRTATVTLANTWLGETSTAEAICTNAGIAGTADEARLVLDRLEVEGAGFSAAWREAPPAAGLAVGEVVAIDVRFTPTQAGHHAGTLSIGGTGQLEELVLSGVGAEWPSVLPLPEAVDFGTLQPGCETRDVTVELVNLTSTAATVHSVKMGEGQTDAFFVRSSPWPGTVIPGGQRTAVTVAYRPTAPGADLGSLVVRFQEIAEPIVVSLRGLAEVPLYRESFTQPYPPKVDFLVVVDNGTSMAEESPWIRQELANLPFAALFSGADAQFAVTTTGLVPGGPGCSGGVDGGEDGRLFPVDGSRPRILDGNTPDRDAAWDANLAVGACHSEPPQGLEAALRALTPPLSASADDPRHPEAADGNLGFLRPDAMLHVLVISDRADVSPGTDDAYYQAFVALKDGDSSRFGFHAVTGDPGEGCGGNGRSAEAGDRLISMVVRTYTGRWGSICDSTLDGLFGWRPVGRRRCFYLQTEPEDLDGDGRIVPADGELRVWVDGVSVPDVADGEPIWQYRPYEVAVCFAPEHVPASGSMIEVEYPVVCLSR